MEPEVLIVRETYLSRLPRKGSVDAGALTAVASVVTTLIYWNRASEVSRHLAGVRARVFADHEYWRLLTGLLVHADLPHLVANVLPLAFLSYLLYGYFGPIVYPLLCVALGVLVHGMALLTYPPDTELVGASGLIYLMAAFWLTLYLCIERRFSLGKRLLRAVGFGLITLLPGTFDPVVSYRTHALGFMTGLCFGVVYFLVRKDVIRQAEVVEVD